MGGDRNIRTRRSSCCHRRLLQNSSGFRLAAHEEQVASSRTGLLRIAAKRHWLLAPCAVLKERRVSSLRVPPTRDRKTRSGVGYLELRRSSLTRGPRRLESLVRGPSQSRRLPVAAGGGARNVLRGSWCVNPVAVEVAVGEAPGGASLSGGCGLYPAVCRRANRLVIPAGSPTCARGGAPVALRGKVAGTSRTHNSTGTFSRTPPKSVAQAGLRDLPPTVGPARRRRGAGRTDACGSPDGCRPGRQEALARANARVLNRARQAADATDSERFDEPAPDPVRGVRWWLQSGTCEVVRCRVPATAARGGPRRWPRVRIVGVRWRCC
jgi:hypothetical protein